MKHLRYFEALARHGHFGRAAEACAITQPALSVQMKELEALLGAPLIERNARQIRLTSLGEELAVRARKILGDVDEIGDLARTVHVPLAGRLRLGVIPTIAPYLLPRLLNGLSARYPDLDLQPRESVTRTLLADLVDGRLDLAIVALPVGESALHEEPLFEEEFVLVRPKCDAGKPVPRPEHLREMRLLLLEEGHCFRDQALAFCNLPEAPARDLMQGSSLSTLVQMVSAGIGVTLIPEMAVAVEAGNAQVDVVRLPVPRPTRRIGMVWRRSSPLGESFRLIADQLRQHAPDLGWRGT
ncbi:Hydrogen peroxide-inducible genes activator [Pseudoruegeria aquimaris]|uniref:Hydrogen peroxide-inducible genes activator n=2 Tax=Pseudoruegeria aquimaris TaxID=393663 RepID=A0A1Y5RRY4_9RHOB|nr:Hydrogen peroxide-inducible genes activator [Pseudoruegeria aquimaris]